MTTKLKLFRNWCFLISLWIITYVVLLIQNRPVEMFIFMILSIIPTAIIYIVILADEM